MIQNNNGYHSPSNKRFTQGPIDGNLYAKVNKLNGDLNTSLNNKANSEVIYTNLYATSIDSGISSNLGEQSTGNKTIYSTIVNSPEARNRHQTSKLNDTESLSQSFKCTSNRTTLNLTTTRSCRNKKEVSNYLDRLDIELINLIQKLDDQKSKPKTSEETELDELLSNMLLELQTTDNKDYNKENNNSKRSEQMFESNQTSAKQQLCGGGRPANAVTASIANEDDIQPTSPRFLKKPSYDSFDSNQTATTTNAGQQPFSYGIQNASPALQRRRLHSEKTAYVSESATPNQQQTDRYQNKLDHRSEENLISLLKQQQSADQDAGRQLCANNSIVSDGSVIAGSENLGWLERQKMKLRNRKEGDQWRERSNKERSLMQELRSAVIPKRLDLNEEESFDQPLHIDTSLGNQSINIPVERSPSNSLFNQQRYQRSQSANYDRYQNAVDPEFRTINTKKKTLQRDTSGMVGESSSIASGRSTPVRTHSPAARSQSPAPSINSLNRKEFVHATNLPIRDEHSGVNQSGYGTISRATSSATNVPINVELPINSTAIKLTSAKQTVDEADLAELIQKASSPIYATSRPTSRQTYSRQSSEQQSIYKTHQPLIYAGYNQSTPIRVIIFN